MEVGVWQVESVKVARRFLESRLADKHIEIDPDLYLNSWARCLGNARLKLLLDGWQSLPHYVYMRVADTVNFLQFDETEVSGCDQTNQVYDSIIISWTGSDDIDSEGVHFDKYFGMSSDQLLNTLWILVSYDGVKPARYASNVLVLTQSKSSYLKALIKIVKVVKGQKKCISGAVESARERVNVVLAAMRSTVGTVLMPYEAQPFQHAINAAVHAGYPHVRTVGYLHSAPPPLATDLLYRPGAPKCLKVHGSGYRDMLGDVYGWPKTIIEDIPSLRYIKSKFETFNGLILLPYSFERPGLILKALEEYLDKVSLTGNLVWTIRNHPVMRKSKKHLELIDDIDRLLSSFPTRTNVDSVCPDTVIIVGATAAILEALESNLDVIHIVSEPLYEIHSQQLWAYIDVEQIGTYAFKYNLKTENEGRYIVFGKGSDGASALFG